MLTSAGCLDRFIKGNESLSNLFVAAGLDHNLLDIYASESNYRKVKRYFLSGGNRRNSRTVTNGQIALLELELQFKFGDDTGKLFSCIFKVPKKR